MGQGAVSEWADEIKIRALTLIDNGVENEKLMTSWERRESARTGKPIDQVLHELIKKHPAGNGRSSAQ